MLVFHGNEEKNEFLFERNEEMTELLLIIKGSTN